MSIVVQFTDYEHCVYESLLETYKNVLTPEIKEQLFKYRRWQDRQAFLLGRLILWNGLKYHYQYEDDCLNKLLKNEYGKPYIDGNIFFNISHSGRYVICAFSDEEIGIDIEEINEIEVGDFKNIFSAQESYYLNTSPNPKRDFFRFWTVKESVVKAVGKGLTFPLQLVNTLDENEVKYGEKKWYVNEIKQFKNYCCSIASTKKLSNFIFERVDFKS